MSIAITFLFKDIFKNKTEFKNFLIEYEISDLNSLEDNMFSEYLYKTLYRKFCNSNIQYSTIDEFLLEFAYVTENNFDKFKRIKELNKKIYNLNDNELENLNKSITNASNNPNTKLDNPEEPIDFVSNQIYNLTKSNKIIAYLTAIKNMPELGSKQITREYGYLFKGLIMPTVYIYN